MQTFLPYRSFLASAQALDRMRLGKQRTEAKQILFALLAAPGAYGWQNHVATRMWRGHEAFLCRYAIAICQEWRDRGYKDTLLPLFVRMHRVLRQRRPETDTAPAWLGDSRVHESHRDMLQYKATVQDPATSDSFEHYHRIWPNFSAPLNPEYVWPSKLPEYQQYAA